MDIFFPCFLQALAAKMAPNTRVNRVAPGFVPTRSAALLRTTDAFVSISPSFNCVTDLAHFTR